MYSNNILNLQKSTTILNAWTEKSGNLVKAPRIYVKMINCGESDKMLNAKMDKSNTYKGFSCDISLFIPRISTFKQLKKSIK